MLRTRFTRDPHTGQNYYINIDTGERVDDDDYYQEGDGIIDGLKSVGKKVVSKLAGKAAKDIAKKALTKAVEKGGEKIGEKINWREDIQEVQ